jgi:hypothetical protein
MTTDTPSPESDHPPPSAPNIPNIKKDYEAALGEFLIVFNQIENLVTDLIVLALRKAGREKLHQSLTGDFYAQKIIYLDLISLRFPEAASPPLIIALQALGNERNKLAHGHFEENPFDESYVIVSRQKRLALPVSKIRRLTQQAETICSELRQSQVFFWFENITEDGS